MSGVQRQESLCTKMLVGEEAMSHRTSSCETEIIEKYNFVKERIIINNWVSKWIYGPSTLFFYV